MGYYTRFELAVTDAKTGVNKIQTFYSILKDAKAADNITDEDREKFQPGYIKRLEDAAEQIRKVPSEVFDNLTYDDAHKWYDHEEHMRLLSKAFPEFIFQLDGSGEETGDVWRKWFHKGKMQGGKAKIVLPDFDFKAFK